MNITYLIIMAVCLVFSAYFSATETAFSTLSKTKLKTLAEKGNKRATRTLAIAEKYDRLISTILVGNNVVNILLATVSTLFFIELLQNTDKANMASTISTAVCTVVVLIFGEITPKSLASDFPEKFAMASSGFIQLIIWILIPVTFIFTLWKKLLALIFRIEKDDKISQEELLLLVEEVQEDGTIDDEEGDLLRNAINFADLKAEDILTHRVDLESFPSDATKEEIAEKFTESRFSRLLMYEDSIDNIVGVIHHKDFFTASGVTEEPLEEIVTKPMFIRPTEPIDALLRDLKNTKSHIAVVVDEYGGTLGIVTMEDILEELVGDIWDEHDEVVEDYKEIAENTFRVDCGGNLDEFCEFFDIEIESESITINGWIMDQLERIPACGDKFTYENLDITVSETDFHRVSTIIVVRGEREDERDGREKDREKDKEKERTTV